MENRNGRKLQLLLLGILLLCLATMITGGCSSVYYYPESRQFYDPAALSYEYESGFLEVEDGEKIHYWYFPSEVRPARAVVLHFHGNAQNISSHFLMSAWLVRFGYDVMIFDYRGYGESDGEPSPENTYRDALAALGEARARANKKSIPIIVFAQSLGGAVALRAIVDSPARRDVALFVADSTFPSYRGIVELKARNILFFPLSTVISWFFSNNRSPEDVLADIAPIPVLVMHSKQDPIVEYENGVQLYDGLMPPRKFLEIPTGGHLAWGEYGRSETDQMLLKIMDGALRAYGSDSDPFEQQ
ncbi:MAG: alpha/beta fold hydrolase [Leptospiraceae bacterium]|nr:alpha/beta fold hydrolase [Leptospiraceae bacterium]